MHRRTPSGSDSNRSAFNLSPVHARKDLLRITCLTADPHNQRLFLGLSSGQVEEHALVDLGNGSTISKLIAERHVSHRHAVVELCCLPVSSRVVARTEDGGVSVYGYESADTHHISGVHNAVALAGDGLRAPARLAVASGSTTKSKVMVFAVASGVGGTTPSGQPTQLLAQVSIVINIDLVLGAWCLVLGQPTQLLAQVSIPDHILGMAWIGDSILLEVTGGYKLVQPGCRVVDVASNVTKLTMMTPLPPLAPTRHRARSGAENPAFTHRDSKGNATHEPLPLPDCPLAFATSGLFIIVVLDDSKPVTGSAVATANQVHVNGKLLLASANQVFCLQPVALETQIRELLAGKRFKRALDLISICKAAGENWAGHAQAQAGLLLFADGRVAEAMNALKNAGLLLLEDGRVAEAMNALKDVPSQTFQPAQLLHLFPEHAAKWIAAGLPDQPYWKLHAPLQSQRAAVHLAAGRYRDTVVIHLLCDTQQVSKLEDLVSRTSSSRLHSSLLDSVNAMEGAGRWHALALFRAARCHGQEALHIWEGLASGQLQETPCSSGAVAEAGSSREAALQVYAAAAAETMCQPPLTADSAASCSVPTPLLLSTLPWLLSISPRHALAVICSSRGEELALEEVLALLVNRTDDLRWQFLHHLVYQKEDLASETMASSSGVEAEAKASPQAGSQAKPPGTALPQAQSSQAKPPGTAHSQAQSRQRGSGSGQLGSSGALVALQGDFEKVALAAGNEDGDFEKVTLAAGNEDVSWNETPEARLKGLHAVMMAHLLQSQGYNSSIVLEAANSDDATSSALCKERVQVYSRMGEHVLALQAASSDDATSSALCKERVQLYSRMGEHVLALQVLALELLDVDSAVTYCRQHSGKWMMLLELLLRPGKGLEPMYSAAVKVLHAEGATLNPIQVLQALPDNMPLHIACNTLTSMMSSTMHQHRKGQVVKNLHRAQNLSARGDHGLKTLGLFGSSEGSNPSYKYATCKSASLISSHPRSNLPGTRVG
eukprot:gene20264-27018_t